ncbi:MAG: hypothetical protein SVS85_00330, partial [Candidatus Nanohaloarchaea archaeon]|nr:hypothetical protein [Candidatus Nanohaloarchaea archaeon]
NISNLPQKVSDFLCRAVTGQGFSKRELYSDDSDIIYSFQRPIALNGINTVPQKADLLDRTILYDLDRIPKKERRTEEDLMQELEDMKPELLCRIFDTMSDAIRLKEGVDLDWRPRMADIAEWGEAIARAMGYNEYEFLRAYQRNIDANNLEALEAHILGEAVLKLMEDRKDWDASPSRTLEKLNEVAEEHGINTNQKKWPGGPQWVWKRLNEIKANLQEVGLRVERDRRGDESGTRTISIEWDNAVSADSAVREEDGSDSTDTTDSTQVSPDVSLPAVVNKVEELQDGSEPVDYEDVFDAFPDSSEERVRKALEKGRKDGDLYEPQQGGVARL